MVARFVAVALPAGCRAPWPVGERSPSWSPSRSSAEALVLEPGPGAQPGRGGDGARPGRRRGPRPRPWCSNQAAAGGPPSWSPSRPSAEALVLNRGPSWSPSAICPEASARPSIESNARTRDCRVRKYLNRGSCSSTPAIAAGDEACSELERCRRTLFYPVSRF